MFHEEKLINGIMHWRGAPDEEFRPYTMEELSRRYEMAVQEINRLLAGRAERAGC